jgi:hypothetical protein
VRCGGGIDGADDSRGDIDLLIHLSQVFRRERSNFGLDMVDHIVDAMKTIPVYNARRYR